MNSWAGGVRLRSFSVMGPMGMREFVSVDDVVAETRQTYRGSLVVGEDLMAFEIGETVSVRKFRDVIQPY